MKNTNNRFIVDGDVVVDTTGEMKVNPELSIGLFSPDDVAYLFNALLGDEAILGEDKIRIVNTTGEMPRVFSSTNEDPFYDRQLQYLMTVDSPSGFTHELDVYEGFVLNEDTIVGGDMVATDGTEKHEVKLEFDDYEIIVCFERTKRNGNASTSVSRVTLNNLKESAESDSEDNLGTNETTHEENQVSAENTVSTMVEALIMKEIYEINYSIMKQEKAIKRHEEVLKHKVKVKDEAHELLINKNLSIFEMRDAQDKVTDYLKAEHEVYSAQREIYKLEDKKRERMAFLEFVRENPEL